MTNPTPGYYVPPTPYVPPPYNPATRTNPFAIASLVTSLLSLSIVGVILGHIALVQVKKRQENGAVLAFIGLVFGYLGCLGWILFWAYFAWTFSYAYGMANQ